MTSEFLNNAAVNVAAVAAGVAQDNTIVEAPYAGTLASATFVPEANITGDNTNKRTFTIVNKGQTGAGTTVMATLDYVTGTNGVAFDEQPFTLSATAANRNFVQGDIIAVVEAVAGTGLANPGGRVAIEFRRTIG